MIRRLLSAALLSGILLALGFAAPAGAVPVTAISPTLEVAQAGGATYAVYVTNNDHANTIYGFAFDVPDGPAVNLRPASNCRYNIRTVSCSITVPPGGRTAMCFDDGVDPYGSFGGVAVRVQFSDQIYTQVGFSTIGAVAGCPVPPPAASITVNQPVVPKPAPVVPCRVPKVTGKTLAAAQKALAAGHCRTGTVTRRRSRRVKRGRVIAQGTRAGRVLARGARINLTVSKGH